MASERELLREIERLRDRVAELESRVEELELAQERNRRALEELNAILA